MASRDLIFMPLTSQLSLVTGIYSVSLALPPRAPWPQPLALPPHGLEGYFRPKPPRKLQRFPMPGSPGSRRPSAAPAASSAIWSFPEEKDLHILKWHCVHLLVLQSSLPSIPSSSVPSQTAALYSLSNDSLSSVLCSSWGHLSTFCFHEYDRSGKLGYLEILDVTSFLPGITVSVLERCLPQF